MVREADFVTKPWLAETTTTVFEGTFAVVTLNVVEVFPTGIVTLLGTDPAALETLVLTTNPPIGAGPLIVTVPIDAVPPFTVFGLRANPVRRGELTVKVTL